MAGEIRNDIDERIRDALINKAEAAGLTLNAYLQTLIDADGGQCGVSSLIDDGPEKFDELLDEFFDQNPEQLPSLPADFSRKDIYTDHD